MTVTTVTAERTRNPFRRMILGIQALAQNPVTVKELRGRMRGRRAFVVLTVHVAIMSTIVTLIYLGFSNAVSNPYGPRPQDAGKAVFGAVTLFQSVMVLFIGPAATAGAISGEKERQTYDILRTTLLTADKFVSGKLLSALSYVFLLVVAAIPIQSIAFLLGGIGIVEILISQLLIVVSAITYALIGLFSSSLLRSTLAASVATYGTAIFFTLGVPGLLIIVAIFLDSFNSGLAEMILSQILVGLISLNLPATMIMSEIVLVEEGTLWAFTQTSGGYTYYILSPWYINLTIFALLAIILYKVTVRRVRRIPV